MEVLNTAALGARWPRSQAALYESVQITRCWLGSTSWVTAQSSELGLTDPSPSLGWGTEDVQPPCRSTAGGEGVVHVAAQEQADAWCCQIAIFFPAFFPEWKYLCQGCISPFESLDLLTIPFFHLTCLLAHRLSHILEAIISVKSGKVTQLRCTEWGFGSASGNLGWGSESYAAWFIHANPVTTTCALQ